MTEIIIDANVILRLFLGDVPGQTRESQKLFEKIEKGEKKGIVSILVINELIWILEHFYEQKRKNYLPLILKLLSLKKIKILEIKKRFLIKILEKMKKSSLDFTDLYLGFLAKEKNFKLRTFDKKLEAFL